MLEYKHSRLYEEFLMPGCEEPKEPTEQEEKDFQNNASSIFLNPAFQKILKEKHGTVFAALVREIGNGDFAEAQKYKCALDELSNLYELFHSWSDRAQSKPNSLLDDPYAD